MSPTPDKQKQKITLKLDKSTIQQIEKIIKLVGFSNKEDFIKIAIKKELDYYRILLEHTHETK